MAGYNLTPAQQKVLRAIVAAWREADPDFFIYDDSEFGIRLVTKTGASYAGGIQCSPDDLKRFRTEDLIEGPSCNEGRPTQRAYEAVDANFRVAEQSPMGDTHIGVQVIGTNRGHVQGTAGQHNRPTYRVDAAGDHADLIIQLGRVTAELCQVVGELLPPEAAVPVIEAAEAARDAASGEKPNARTAANDAGATVAGVLKNIATIGSAADGAVKVSHLLSLISGFLHAHAAVLVGLAAG